MKTNILTRNSKIPPNDTSGKYSINQPNINPAVNTNRFSVYLMRLKAKFNKTSSPIMHKAANEKCKISNTAKPIRFVTLQVSEALPTASRAQLFNKKTDMLIFENAMIIEPSIK